MDPATHLILPLLILLAARQDPRLVIPLSFFAILPDLDSIVGIHRATLHNIFVILVIPLAFIFWAKLRKPQLLLPGLIVLFYLVSHAILDMNGISLLYPIYHEVLFLRPALNLQTDPEFDFDLVIDYGMEEPIASTEYVFISDLGFAYMLLFILLTAVFRKEIISGFRDFVGYAREMILKLMKRK